MSVLFIVGRPAAGKTTVACAIKACIEGRNSLVSIATIDEYAILKQWIKSLGPRDIEWHRDGTFELIDRTFLSKTAADLEARTISYMKNHDLVICELARAAYTPLFDAFGRHIRDSMQILYVHAPLKLCRVRNQRRRRDDSQSYVPDLVLTRYYAADDFHKLMGRYNARCCRLDNSQDNTVILSCNVSEYVEHVRDDLVASYAARSEVGVEG